MSHYLYVPQFLICSEKVKDKNFYMLHKSVEGLTFTEAQTSNPKISLTLCFVQHEFNLPEKKNLILYLQYTEMSFKFTRN